MRYDGNKKCKKWMQNSNFMNKKREICGAISRELQDIRNIKWSIGGNRLFVRCR